MADAPGADHAKIRANREENRALVDQLTPYLYRELHRLAGSCLRRERPGHTLQATALVNEAYMRLLDQSDVQWRNRAHFLGVAAQVMRYVLLDYAKSRRAVKRGGGLHKTSLEEGLVLSDERLPDLLVIDDALARLEQLDPQQSKVVEMRFFGGFSVEETAEAMGISTATVKREWRMARAWLERELT